ncbi:hypothetical protein CH380_08405 [Leptospira adleri]|uniref:Uncharacterized protein n=1 Tax=Leptospira adleri TaxID=2023186 RepID=A0A2M9YQ00_9LEPT|nr:hypothetical protein CH380_08405 [Leptospira adleri]PJZ61413.1 hypothetical protein CH376_13550 [Leptospira adleri]
MKSIAGDFDLPLFFFRESISSERKKVLKQSFQISKRNGPAWRSFIHSFPKESRSFKILIWRERSSVKFFPIS